MGIPRNQPRNLSNREFYTNHSTVDDSQQLTKELSFVKLIN